MPTLNNLNHVADSVVQTKLSRRYYDLARVYALGFLLLAWVVFLEICLDIFGGATS